MAQLVGGSSHNTKIAGLVPSQGTCLGCRLDSQSPVGVPAAGSQSVFLSHIDLSLSLSFPHPPLPNENKINLKKSQLIIDINHAHKILPQQRLDKGVIE